MRALILTCAGLATAAALAADPPETRSTMFTPSAESTVRPAVLAYLALWSADALPEAANGLFSNDLVLSYSQSIPELEAEIRGRTSVVNQVRAVAHLGRDWKFRDVRLFPTLNPSVYFVQYTATGISAIDGASIEQSVLLSVELDQSRVVRIVEYSNPAIASATRPPEPSALR